MSVSVKLEPCISIFSLVFPLLGEISWTHFNSLDSLSNSRVLKMSSLVSSLGSGELLRACNGDCSEESSGSSLAKELLWDSGEKPCKMLWGDEKRSVCSIPIIMITSGLLVDALISVIRVVLCEVLVFAPLLNIPASHKHITTYSLRTATSISGF